MSCVYCDEFDWVPDWLSDPPLPTPAAIRGAELLRKLQPGLVELADTAGLNPAAERHVGSNPTAGTNAHTNDPTHNAHVGWAGDPDVAQEIQ